MLIKNMYSLFSVQPEESSDSIEEEESSEEEDEDDKDEDDKDTVIQTYTQQEFQDLGWLTLDDFQPQASR